MRWNWDPEKAKAKCCEEADNGYMPRTADLASKGLSSLVTYISKYHGGIGICKNNRAQGQAERTDSQSETYGSESETHGCQSEDHGLQSTTQGNQSVVDSPSSEPVGPAASETSYPFDNNPRSHTGRFGGQGQGG